MKVWVLHDVDERGEILGITGVTTDAETAAIWRAEFPLYVAEEFDTDDALREVSEIIAMNAAMGRLH